MGTPNPRSVASPDRVVVTVRGSRYANANQRQHHMATAELVGEWRANGKAAALALGRDMPRLTRVRIVAYVKHRDRRRRDVANVYPSVKAALDGIVDAGMLPDDSDRHVTGPDMRPHPALSPIPTIELHIYPLDQQ